MVQVVIRVTMKEPKELRLGSYNMVVWAREIGRDIVRYMQNDMSKHLFEGVDSIEVVTSDTLNFPGAV